MGKIYIVATPIGNLEDITLRALRILNEVDLILAEDTRVIKKLLNKYKIENKIVVSYNSHTSQNKENQIIDWLREGKEIALVSDAGTPTISDPGVKIVEEIQKQLGNQVDITPIPGPSALITALSVSGFGASEFVFYGFLPHKKGRETIFKEIAQNNRTSVFYESPHRFLKALESLEKFSGPEREVFIARELTKIYEEKIKGSVREVKEYFQKNPNKIKGEFVIIVDKT